MDEHGQAGGRAPIKERPWGRDLVNEPPMDHSEFVRVGIRPSMRQLGIPEGLQEILHDGGELVVVVGHCVGVAPAIRVLPGLRRPASTSVVPPVGRSPDKRSPSRWSGFNSLDWETMAINIGWDTHTHNCVRVVLHVWKPFRDLSSVVLLHASASALAAPSTHPR